MTLRQAYSHARERLAAGCIENACGISNAAGEAQYLLTYTLGADRQQLALNGGQDADAQGLQRLEELLTKRLAGYPLQYLLGEWEFYGLPFFVGEGVLIPRADTETLVDTVLHELGGKSEPAPRIVDLCSGSGCIACALQHMLPKADITAADITAVELSDKALQYLRRNVSRNAPAVKIVQGDVCDAEFAGHFGSLDCVVANPPYLTHDDMLALQAEVRHEPSLALYAGVDGLLLYRAIARLWVPRLRSGGLIAFEIGKGQENAVTEILHKNGIANICTNCDLCGIIRVVYGTKQ